MNGKLGLLSLDLPGQVFDAEETVYVDGIAIVNVFPVHMRQARGSHIYARAPEDAILDTNVIFVLRLDVGGRFDFDEAPAPVSTPMQDVHFYEHVLVLKYALKNRRNVRLFD